MSLALSDLDCVLDVLRAADWQQVGLWAVASLTTGLCVGRSAVRGIAWAASGAAGATRWLVGKLTPERSRLCRSVLEALADPQARVKGDGLLCRVVVVPDVNAPLVDNCFKVVCGEQDVAGTLSETEVRLVRAAAQKRYKEVLASDNAVYGEMLAIEIEQRLGGAKK